MASFIEFKGKEESTVTEVPGFLLPDFGTHVLGALTGNQNLSMKIHHDQGQSLKLEITSGGIPGKRTQFVPSSIQDYCKNNY